MRCLHSHFIRASVSCLFFTALLLTSGCTSFNHDWNTAAKQSISTNDIRGRWQGTWQSEADGHTDQLRCVVTRKEGGQYLARFHAKYRKVFSFGYTVPLQVTQTNDVSQFSGAANLGWYAGGVYHYQGHANATNFFSTYSCKYDHGTFQMTRPR
jgi:hypothetical protein